MAGTWTPGWQANHAYVVPAVVIPTAAVFAGWTWRCTTAGTSAGTEPVWPTDPSVSPTVTDGTVTWSVGTGARQAIQYGITSLVQGFATANPTIIRQVRTTRPRSLTTADLPVFYIGDLNESIVTSQGTMTRTFDAFSAFLVDNIGEQIESSTRMDFAADALTDLFVANPHAASGRSLFRHTGTLDTEVGDGPTPFAALEFIFAQTIFIEGRN